MYNEKRDTTVCVLFVQLRHFKFKDKFLGVQPNDIVKSELRDERLQSQSNSITACVQVVSNIFFFLLQSSSIPQSYQDTGFHTHTFVDTFIV